MRPAATCLLSWCVPTIGWLARAHRAASPFPHTVIDHFCRRYYLTHCRQSRMEMDPQQFVREPQLGMHQQRKQRLKIGRQPLPTAVQAVLNIFANQAMARYLSNLTGIENLLPDPLLVGGGVQAVMPGGRLELHTDFTHHPVTGRKRAASALLFLNKGWRDDWGGALELWDAPAEPVSVNSTSGSRKNGYRRRRCIACGCARYWLPPRNAASVQQTSGFHKRGCGGAWAPE